jgi:hypothetical protein
MKRLIFTLSILTLFSSTLYSQKIEDVGAGVINFLLRNPKTANKMNTTEAVALDIIGDLLKTESQRKHQLEYASAGRNQVTINSNDGRQAQFVRSETGKVFLLIDGVIYPVATELVNQAKGVEPNKEITATNNDSYDLTKLRNQYNTSGYGEKIIVAFAYKWAKDFNKDGYYEFSEYKQVKNSFYNNENFKLVVAYDLIDANEKEYTIICEVFDDYTGERVDYKSSYADKGKFKLQFFDIAAESWTEGKYLLYIKLHNRETSEDVSYLTNEIHIKQGDPSTKEVSILEKNYRKKIGYNCPKNIFFCSTWKDKNNNGRYDYEEFNNLNKKSYSLSKDILTVGINFPNKTGEIIIQSWTMDGELLGTTTKSYQRLMTNSIFPGSNPYDEMNFIDMVKIKGIGEYKITVSFVEGGTFEQKLIITE